MEPCKYKLSVVIIFLYLGTIQETFGDKVLGIGVEDSDNNDLLEGFTCPGEGKYAVKQAGNCAKYFDCTEEGAKPSAIMECDEPQHYQFHRLNRTCVETEYVNCRWCRKPGRHMDLTSANHFIECVKGTIGLRYICKHKKPYNPETRECETEEKFDISLDAKLDPPADIIEFQKEWNEEQKELDKEEYRRRKHHNSKRQVSGIEDADSEVIQEQKMDEKRSVISEGQENSGNRIVRQGESHGIGQEEPNQAAGRGFFAQFGWGTKHKDHHKHHSTEEEETTTKKVKKTEVRIIKTYSKSIEDDDSGEHGHKKSKSEVENAEKD